MAIDVIETAKLRVVNTCLFYRIANKGEWVPNKGISDLRLSVLHFSQNIKNGFRLLISISIFACGEGVT